MFVANWSRPNIFLEAKMSSALSSLRKDEMQVSSVRSSMFLKTKYRNNSFPYKLSLEDLSIRISAYLTNLALNKFNLPVEDELRLWHSQTTYFGLRRCRFPVLLYFLNWELLTVNSEKLPWYFFWVQSKFWKNSRNDVDLLLFRKIK